MSPTCEEVLTALGEGPSSPALAAHAQDCPHCQSVLKAHEAMGRAAGGAGGAGADGPARPAQALAELAAHPRAMAWWLPAAVLVVVPLAVALAGAGAMAGGGWVHNRAPVVALSSVAAGLALALVAGALAGFARGGRRAREWVLAWAVAAAASMVLGGSGLGLDRPFLAGSACMWSELAVSALPWAVALWMLRRTAFDPLRAWVAGTAAAAAGPLVLHFHCADGTPAHLLAFHVAPWLLLGALTVAARRVLPSRSYAP